MSNRSNSAGNSQSRSLDKLLAQSVDNLVRFDMTLDRWADEGWEFVGMSIKGPFYTGQGDWLVTVRANIDNVPCVAFNGGSGLLEALNGTVVRWSNKSLKWKEDAYGR